MSTGTPIGFPGSPTEILQELMARQPKKLITVWMDGDGEVWTAWSDMGTFELTAMTRMLQYVADQALVNNGDPRG